MAAITVANATFLQIPIIMPQSTVRIGSSLGRPSTVSGLEVVSSAAKTTILAIHPWISRSLSSGGPQPQYDDLQLSVLRLSYEQVYFKATDPFNEKWQSAWIITAFWDILAFALLCVICYLWAPSQTPQSVLRLSYEQVYFKATDPFNEKWQSAWIITAFWDILAFALLCVICYLWAPSQTSQRYAYSEERGEDSDGEESEALYSGTSNGDIGLVKQERREKNGQNEDDLNLDEDNGAEEGKRE
ncbi:lung seven transmembrane receptor family protein [Artemisia annua]|uniref:Lung seven transmembrane receptor family protein n=1 Tax=Artemisia annua TaxID=35608 RepID=A0A2U1KGB3_ARTAN|nr:lung seven transmembrane receptor family protein [Artemisia annua]